MRTTEELLDMANVLNDILDRIKVLESERTDAFVDRIGGHVVFTIHHKGVDYVKYEDYMALAKTIGDGSKAIDANEALRRLTVLARDYMTGSETGEADVDKYAKIVSAALSSAERSARR